MREEYIVKENRGKKRGFKKGKCREENQDYLKKIEKRMGRNPEEILK